MLISKLSSTVSNAANKSIIARALVYQNSIVGYLLNPPEQFLYYGMHGMHSDSLVILHFHLGVKLFDLMLLFQPSLR